MRSSNIFLIFGGILVALVLFTVLSKKTMSSNPVMLAANGFLVAAKNDDLTAIQRLVDPKAGTVTQAGNRLVSVVFKGGTMFSGAFSHRDREIWSKTELAELEINPKIPPIVVTDVQGGMATLTMTNKSKLYLHVVDNEWRVFYLGHPEAESK